MAKKRVSLAELFSDPDGAHIDFDRADFAPTGVTILDPWELASS